MSYKLRGAYSQASVNGFMSIKITKHQQEMRMKLIFENIEKYKTRSDNTS